MPLSVRVSRARPQFAADVTAPRAAEDRTDSENIKVVGRNYAARGTLGAIADAEYRSTDVLSNEGFHQRVVSVLKVGPRNIGAASAVGSGQGKTCGPGVRRAGRDAAGFLRSN